MSKESSGKEKLITGTSAAAVLIIAAASFILSFNAIKELAIQNGTPENLAWLVPVVVDASMLAFSMHALRASIVGEDTRVSWGLIIFFTGISIAFNVAHSNRSSWGIAIAAIAPLALFTSFETLMSQIKSIVRRTNSISKIQELLDRIAELNAQHENLKQTITQDAEQHAQKMHALALDLQRTQEEHDSRIETLQKERAELERENSNARTTQNANGLSIEQQMMLVFLHANPDASLADAARVIGKSKSTVTNYRKQLAAAGLLEKNGSGWIVTNA